MGRILCETFNRNFAGQTLESEFKDYVKSLPIISEFRFDYQRLRWGRMILKLMMPISESFSVNRRLVGISRLWCLLDEQSSGARPSENCSKEPCVCT